MVKIGSNASAFVVKIVSYLLGDYLWGIFVFQNIDPTISTIGDRRNVTILLFHNWEQEKCDDPTIPHLGTGEM